MEKCFNSVAEIRDFINRGDEAVVNIVHEMTCSVSAVNKVSVAFMSVSYNGHSAMWRFDNSPKGGISVQKTLIGKAYPANTPTELTRAMSILSQDLVRR